MLISITSLTNFKTQEYASYFVAYKEKPLIVRQYASRLFFLAPRI